MTTPAAAAAPIPARHHGPHPRPPHADAAAIEWYRVHPPAEPARIHDNTCECRAVLYEYCSRGGAYVIRRTTRRPGTVVVEETPQTRAAAAAALWAQLIAGTAR